MDLVLGGLPGAVPGHACGDRRSRIRQLLLPGRVRVCQQLWGGLGGNSARL